MSDIFFITFLHENNISSKHHYLCGNAVRNFNTNFSPLLTGVAKPKPKKKPRQNQFFFKNPKLKPQPKEIYWFSFWFF